MLLAAAIGVPTGIWLTRHPRWAKPVLGVVNIIQTIPSLAFFGFLLPLAVDWRSRGAYSYCCADCVCAAADRAQYLRRHRRGRSHRAGGCQSAGHDQWPEVRKVELPLAAGFILAGLRTATVLAVGIATIAAAVGAGGLGEFIFRGVASVDNRLVLAGAIPAALLAIAADTGLGWIENRLKVPAPGRA